MRGEPRSCWGTQKRYCGSPAPPDPHTEQTGYAPRCLPGLPSPPRGRDQEQQDAFQALVNHATVFNSPTKCAFPVFLKELVLSVFHFPTSRGHGHTTSFTFSFTLSPPPHMLPVITNIVTVVKWQLTPRHRAGYRERWGLWQSREHMRLQRQRLLCFHTKSLNFSVFVTVWWFFNTTHANKVQTSRLHVVCV